MRLARPSRPCGPCGSTVWWISLVAFHTRKRPPAIRIRSRQEKPWPKAVKTGWVSPTMKEIVASSTSRMISAAEMPRRRALTRCSGGSLLVRIEMKMRLSMPSTTSIAISVTMRRPALSGWSGTRNAGRWRREWASVTPCVQGRLISRPAAGGPGSQEPLRQEPPFRQPFPAPRARCRGIWAAGPDLLRRTRRRAGRPAKNRPRRKRFPRRRRRSMLRAARVGSRT